MKAERSRLIPRKHTETLVILCDSYVDSRKESKPFFEEVCSHLRGL